MAEAGRRDVDSDSEGSDSSSVGTASAQDQKARSETGRSGAKAGSRRVTPPKARREENARYTAKGTKAQSKGPSPQWVPITMFALWAIGLLILILNYMTLLPGASNTASGWYLIAGLVALLAGIVVATQYR